MNKLRIFNLVLLVLLGLAAGFAKVLVVPDELTFFQQLGLSELIMVVFGGCQILASLLIALKQTHRFGLSLLLLTFLGSSIMIFITGKVGFAIFSMLPLLMAFFAYKFPAKGFESIQKNAEDGL